MNKIFLGFFLLIVGCNFLAGCGQTGPLYPPPPCAPTPPPPPIMETSE